MDFGKNYLKSVDQNNNHSPHKSQIDFTSSQSIKCSILCSKKAQAYWGSLRMGLDIGPFSLGPGLDNLWQAYPIFGLGLDDPSSGSAHHINRPNDTPASCPLLRAEQTCATTAMSRQRPHPRTLCNRTLGLDQPRSITIQIQVEVICLLPKPSRSIQ